MHDKLIVLNGYIVYVGKNHPRYAEIIEIFRNKPPAENGYDYRIKDDLSWELYKLPEPEPSEEEATIEDYETVLQEVGI